MDAAGPIRILHVFGTVGLGGAESRIMDLYRNIDRNRIQFDFLVHYEPDKTGKKCPTSDELMMIRQPDYFDEEIRSLGGNIYCVPRFSAFNILQYRKALKTFFMEKAGTWKMVQGHITSTAAIYLPIARKSGVQTTISHVRSGGTDPGLKGKLTNFLRRPLKKSGTVDFRFSCTEAAARSVYGDKAVDDGLVHVIPNAISVDKFLFNAQTRSEIRKELGLTDNDIVIGHVGRFHYAKNHEFLIRVFAQLTAIVSRDSEPDSFFYGKNVRLMLAGEGPLMDNARKQAMELGMENQVMFMGNRSNVSDYYQAMDYFCFPSRYEGLPGTVVEAQAAGLMCLVSDSITDEVDITELVMRMSLEQSENAWARQIMKDLMHEKIRQDSSESEMIDCKSAEFKENVGKSAVGRYADRSTSSEEICKCICEAGFDAKTQSRMMTYFYENGHFQEGGQTL